MNAPPDPPVARKSRVLECLVAASVLLALAGVVVPYSTRTGEDARQLRAADGVDAIARHLATFAQDVRDRTRRPGHPMPELPAIAAADAAPAWLRGPGMLPIGSPRELAAAQPLESLALPTVASRSRLRSHMIALDADPWGSAYVIRLDGLVSRSGESVVISAGPDRVLHTRDDLSQLVD
jgi:hypothetical protein